MVSNALGDHCYCPDSAFGKMQKYRIPAQNFGHALNSWKEFYCSDNGLYKVYGTTGSTSVRLRVYTLKLNRNYVNFDVAR